MLRELVPYEYTADVGCPFCGQTEHLLRRYRRGHRREFRIICRCTRTAAGSSIHSCLKEWMTAQPIDISREHVVSERGDGYSREWADRWTHRDRLLENLLSGLDHVQHSGSGYLLCDVETFQEMNAIDEALLPIGVRITQEVDSLDPPVHLRYSLHSNDSLTPQDLESIARRILSVQVVDLKILYGWDGHVSVTGDRRRPTGN